MHSRPAAVLFDLDGTLIDTEGHYIDSAERLLNLHGLDWDDEGRVAAIGCAMETLADLLRSAGLDMPSDTIISIVTEHVMDSIRASVPWRKGAVELISSVFDSSLSSGLVTMSYRSVTDIVQYELREANFDVVVTGDDVSIGKPNPEAYLRAAELLNIDPEDCLVLEDSTVGAAAARAAGMRVVGVPFYRPLPPGTADVVWEDLADKSVADLLGAWRT